MGASRPHSRSYADSLDEHLTLLAHYYGRSDDLRKRSRT